MSVFDHIKRLAPLIIIAIIGVIVFFSLRDDEFPVNDDVTEEGAVVQADELALDLVIENSTEGELDDEIESQVIVDIKGEVNKPGVYVLTTGDRIQRVIELAGGFSNDADEQQINLAQKVYDEMVIYVPEIGEIEGPLQLVQQPTVNSTETNSTNDLIHVNSATEDELTRLQGIGPSKAHAILAYRDEHGPFQQVEDLLEVSGIGEKTLENIRDYIIVP